MGHQQIENEHIFKVSFFEVAMHHFLLKSFDVNVPFIATDIDSTSESFPKYLRRDYARPRLLPDRS
jgi:hypothetical protein